MLFLLRIPQCSKWSFTEGSRTKLRPANYREKTQLTTSVGRKYFGSTFTCTTPVSWQRPTSCSSFPSHLENGPINRPALFSSVTSSHRQNMSPALPFFFFFFCLNLTQQALGTVQDTHTRTHTHTHTHSYWPDMSVSSRTQEGGEREVRWGG